MNDTFYGVVFFISNSILILTGSASSNSRKLSSLLRSSQSMYTLTISTLSSNRKYLIFWFPCNVFIKRGMVFSLYPSWIYKGSCEFVFYKETLWDGEGNIKMFKGLTLVQVREYSIICTFWGLMFFLLLQVEFHTIARISRYYFISHMLLLRSDIVWNNYLPIKKCYFRTCSKAFVLHYIRSYQNLKPD